MTQARQPSCTHRPSQPYTKPDASTRRLLRSNLSVVPYDPIGHSDAALHALLAKERRPITKDELIEAYKNDPNRKPCSVRTYLSHFCAPEFGGNNLVRVASLIRHPDTLNTFHELGVDMDGPFIEHVALNFRVSSKVEMEAPGEEFFKRFLSLNPKRNLDLLFEVYKYYSLVEYCLYRPDGRPRTEENIRNRQELAISKGGMLEESSMAYLKELFANVVTHPEFLD